jgi:hypothetical protein
MEMELRSREIDKMHKRRDRYEIPEWQRGEVWSPEKKQALLDTILRGWHLPKFYFVKTSDPPETWEVVDGQQRLVAIFEFLNDKLGLSDDTARVFGGPHYSELPPDVSDRFDDYKLDYEEIIDAEEGEVQEYFQRLQQGLPLTSAERLNAVPGNLTAFIRNLSQHRFFEKKVALRDYRYAHFDICCKVAALEIEGFGIRLRLPELQDLLRNNPSFSNNSIVGRRVQRTFDWLDDEVFTEPSPLLRNRSIVQSFTTLTARLLQAGEMKGKGAHLHDFFEAFTRELVKEVEKGHQATQKDLLEFQSTISANVLTGPETRHKILMRKLLLFDSEFADVLGPQSVAEAGFAAHVAELAGSVRDSMYVLNKDHESKHGVDLFKPTNETGQAFAVISQPTTNLEEYGKFIDALYFLLFEGTGDGQRFDGGLPPVVGDIRSLRTQIRHDLDHGEPSKVRSKRKALGKTFAKYGNVSSPEVLSPEKSPLVQARVLTSVADMLRQLRAALSV